MSEDNKQNVKLARIDERVKTNTERIKKKVDFSRFSPVEKIVYGMVAMILCSFLGAMIALILK